MKSYISILKGIAIVFSVAITTSSHAQMSQYKFDQIYSIAFQELVSGNYAEAESLFGMLNKADSDHAQVQYLLALCQVNTNSQDVTTLNLLQKAAAHYDYYHQSGDVNDRSAPPKVWFLLGAMNAQFGKHAKAVEAYRNYMSCIPLASLEHKRDVILRIADSREQIAKVGIEGVSILANLKP